jgi:hypothetical protein
MGGRLMDEEFVDDVAGSLEEFQNDVEYYAVMRSEPSGISDACLAVVGGFIIAILVLVVLAVVSS